MWPENFNYAKILLGLREGRVTDWLSHCKNLGYTPPFPNVSYASHLIGELQSLNVLGVVEFELPEDYGGLTYLRDGGNFKIKLNHTAINWLGLLNISLSDLAKVDLDRMMICTPNFPELKKSKSELYIDVFVVMPFGGEFNEIYTNHIKPICRERKVTCLRGDELSGSDIIVSEIYQLIKNAGLIVADCTGRNPNVCYELGIAHTIGKDCVLFTRDISDAPFDLKHLRHYIYQYTPPGMKHFEQALVSNIEYYFPNKAI